MKEKNTAIATRVAKKGRSYSAQIKRKIVEELNAGLLSHRSAEKKYGVNRKHWALG